MTDKETSGEGSSQEDLSMLTLDRIDHTVAIFDQLFEEFAGPLQLHFITLEGLPEARTVQIAIAELQGRMPHVSKQHPRVCIHGRNSGRVVASHAADARLPHAAHHRSQLRRLHTLVWPEESALSAGNTRPTRATSFRVCFAFPSRTSSWDSADFCASVATFSLLQSREWKSG